MSKILIDPLGAILTLILGCWLLHSHPAAAATLAVVTAAGAGFIWFVLKDAPAENRNGKC